MTEPPRDSPAGMTRLEIDEELLTVHGITPTVGSDQRAVDTLCEQRLARDHQYNVWTMEEDMYSPANATHQLGSHGDLYGRWIGKWATESGEYIKTMIFLPFPRKADMPPQPRDLLVKFWHELDNEIDVIRSDPNADAIESAQHKTRATTIAWMLSEIMSPFYADGNAVLAESMVRWTARQEGRDHESPGLAESIWDPQSRFDGTPYSKENVERARSGGARTITPVKLEDNKVTFIKHALENGSMTADALAKMFGVSIEVIQAAVDS